MARAISKKMVSATIYGFDATKEFQLDESGNPIANVVIQCDGNPSENKARILLERECGTKNVMVMNIEIDESKLNASSEDFYNHSEKCEEGVNYGREFITRIFKVTAVGGFYFDNDNKLQPFSTTYFDVTTDSKLLNWVRDVFDTNRVTITASEVIEEKRYMKRDDYFNLAK